jgi:hypothetical protein
MLLLLSIATGFWIFFTFLLVMRLTKKIGELPAPIPLSNTATEENKKEERRKEVKLRRTKAARAIACFLIGLGVVTLTVIAGMQSDAISGMVASWIAFIASVAAKTTALGWITLGAWVLPALYIAAILFYTSDEDRTDDTQRARYLDSVKTLVTAAGLTIGVVISTALKPENAPPGWAETIRSGVIALAISIGCSVVTLFMLSVLYDRAGNKVLKRREFLIVAPFMYFALAMFFTGFIYMVQLTTLVVAQPKLPPGGHP